MDYPQINTVIDRLLELRKMVATPTGSPGCDTYRQAHGFFNLKVDYTQIRQSRYIYLSENLSFKDKPIIAVCI